MLKSKKTLYGLYSVVFLMGLIAITILTMSLSKTEEQLWVKEGDLVGVNDYIHAETLGGKVVESSNFYLTYVNTAYSFNKLGEFQFATIEKYEKEMASQEGAYCIDFNYQDEAKYIERTMPIMGMSIVSSAMHAVGIEPQGVLLDPVVMTVSHNSEVGKLFKPGDELISINGEDLIGGDDVTYILSTYKEGDPIKVKLRRDGQLQTVSFIAKERDCFGQLTAGVVAETMIDIQNVDEEKIIDIAGMDFKGNSGGLMLSLGLAQQMMPEEDLTNGLKIAGTGSVNVIGVVGEIGSLDMKIRTAIARHADVFLYPASQADEVNSKYSDQIKLIAVESLEQAIAELKKLKNYKRS